MNYQKAFIMPCTKHESKKIGFVCTKIGCKDRFVCVQCYKGHPDSHKENFISIMEIFAEDFAEEYKELAKIIKDSSRATENALNDLDLQFDQIKEDFIAALDEVRAEVKENFQNSNLEGQGVKLKYHLDKITDFLDMPDEMVISSRADLAESLSHFMDLRNLIKNTKIETPVVYKNRNQQFDKLKKFINELLTKQMKLSVKTSTPVWKWNSSKMSGELKIKDEGMSVSLPSGSGNHGILADTVLSSGIHEWFVQHDGNIKEGNWGIGFGLMSKKKIDSVYDWESFPYNQCLCLSTSGTVHNLSSKEKVNLKGKKGKVVVNFDEEKIKFFHEDKLLAEGEVKKGEEYIPFLDFNHVGTATLSFA